MKINELFEKIKYDLRNYQELENFLIKNNILYFIGNLYDFSIKKSHWVFNKNNILIINNLEFYSSKTNHMVLVVLDINGGVENFKKSMKIYNEFKEDFKKKFFTLNIYSEK